MKKQSLIMAFAIVLVLPVGIKAQIAVQPIPDGVNEIRVEGSTKLYVVQGDMAQIEVNGSVNNVAKLKNGVLRIESEDNPTLRLKKGEPLKLTAEDASSVIFKSVTDFGGSLYINAEDASTVTLDGAKTDTIHCANIHLIAQDAATLNIKLSFASETFNLECLDAATLNYYDKELAKFSLQRTKVTTSDYIEELPSEDIIEEALSSDDIEEIRKELGDYEIFDKVAEKINKVNHPSWSHGDWDFDVDFAWGWHNWGSNWYNGFGGVENDASTKTSFNNIQLSINMPVVSTQCFALYAGLGLEWDVFKFDRNFVTFSTPSNGLNQFVGADSSWQSQLRTRYVELPISLKFDLGNDWQVAITGIPGLYWAGNNSGIRRESINEKITDKEINKYITPYKFDVRLSVQYNSFGIYVQTSMLSVLRDNCQELFPIKFGIIL